MITNSLSALYLPRLRIIERKKLRGKINSRNSGKRRRTTMNTISGLISPLAACSKYWMEREETIMSIKIKLIVRVYEKILFRK
tara:strand:+ start:532 stop:780 length:249 start_codon:yes stop_codon:yes gene_type:complete